jgi:hypothetical protein
MRGLAALSFSVAGLTYWHPHRAVPARSKGVHLLPIYDEYLHEIPGSGT